MAEVTYYFNAYSATERWNNPAGMADGNTSLFADTTVNNEVQRLTGNTCPGDNLGTITKIEIRAYAKGDGDDELYIRPEFTGGMGDNHITVPVVSPGDWGAYQDITNDPNAPDWSLWSHIQDLDCDIELDDTGKGNTMYCAKVEIRITYTPVGVPENTVYLVKATGKRTQLSTGAVAIRIDPATGRRSLDTSLTKFLVREDDGTLRAKSA